MGVDLRNYPFAPGLSSGWNVNFWRVAGADGYGEVRAGAWVQAVGVDGQIDGQSDGQIDGQIITSRDATEMAPIPTMSPTASRGPASGQGAAEPFLAVEGASFAVWSPS